METLRTMIPLESRLVALCSPAIKPDLASTRSLLRLLTFWLCPVVLVAAPSPDPQLIEGERAPRSFIAPIDHTQCIQFVEGPHPEIRLLGGEKASAPVLDRVALPDGVSPYFDSRSAGVHKIGPDRFVVSVRPISGWDEDFRILKIEQNKLLRLSPFLWGGGCSSAKLLPDGEITLTYRYAPPLFLRLSGTAITVDHERSRKGYEAFFRERDGVPFSLEGMHQAAKPMPYLYDALLTTYGREVAPQVITDVEARSGTRSPDFDGHYTLREAHLILGQDDPAPVPTPEAEPEQLRRNPRYQSQGLWALHLRNQARERARSSAWLYARFGYLEKAQLFFEQAGDTEDAEVVSEEMARREVAQH
jgi:hypothetical protein